MRMLVDANALLWAVDSPVHLSRAAEASLRDPANQLMLSAATVWEISIKVGLAKLSLSLPFLEWINTAIADLGMTIMPVTPVYADAQNRLPLHHRDPFDRLLIAQAVTEGWAIISSDVIFDRYGVDRIWD